MNFSWSLFMAKRSLRQLTSAVTRAATLVLSMPTERSRGVEYSARVERSHLAPCVCVVAGVAFLSLSCISVRRHHQHMKTLKIVSSTIPTRNFFDLGSTFITRLRLDSLPNAKPPSKTVVKKTEKVLVGLPQR